MQKCKSKNKAEAMATVPPTVALKPEASAFVPGPKLRALLGISPVTLWRWRHDEQVGFPAAKVIKGRLYFSLAAVSDWLARQPEAM